MRVDVRNISTFYESRLGAVTRARLLSAMKTAAAEAQASSADSLSGADHLLCAGAEAASFAAALNSPARAIHVLPPVLDAGEAARHPYAIVDTDRLPFAASLFDGALITHGLEFTGDAPEFVRELWRVLRPEACATFVVPNRLGIWAQSEATPFGFGQPYSHRQLTHLLEHVNFHPVSCHQALYFAPTHKALNLKLAPKLERWGRRLDRGGGALIMTVRKRVHARSKPKGLAQKVRPLIDMIGNPLPEPAPTPSRKPRRTSQDTLEN